MSKLKIILFAFISTLLLVGSCKLSKKKNIPYRKMNTLSEIKLPIKIEKEGFINLIDSHLPDTLFEGDEKEGFPLNIKIFKGKLNNIEFVGKDVNINLSLLVEVEKKLFSIPTKGTGEIQLDLFSQIDIEGWKLKTTTSLVDYQWIKKPIIKTKWFETSDFNLISKIIDSEQSDWMKQVDSAIVKQDFLRKGIDSLVSKLNLPIPLDSLGVIGLKITPKKIELSPFKTEDNNIFGVVGFTFKTDIISNSRFTKANDLQPEFAWNYSEDDKQHIEISLEMDENQVQNIIDDYMFVQPPAERKISINEDTIQIDKIDVIIENELVGASIDFSGYKRGDIKFKTRPFWNEKLDSLKLIDSDVDISMKGFGTKMLLSLFRNKAEKIIIDKTEEQLNDKIKEILQETNSVFENSQYKNTLQLANFKMPMQVEEGVLLTDIYFNIVGNIYWREVKLEFLSNGNLVQ